MIITGRFIAVNLRFMISWEILVHVVCYYQNLFNFFLNYFSFYQATNVWSIHEYSLFRYRVNGPNLAHSALNIHFELGYFNRVGPNLILFTWYYSVVFNTSVEPLYGRLIHGSLKLVIVIKYTCWRIKWNAQFSGKHFLLDFHIPGNTIRIWIPRVFPRKA